MLKIWNNTEWVEVKELSEKCLGTFTESYPVGTINLRFTVGKNKHYLQMSFEDGRKMANKILEQCGD